MTAVWQIKRSEAKEEEEENKDEEDKKKIELRLKEEIKRADEAEELGQKLLRRQAELEE